MPPDFSSETEAGSVDLFDRRFFWGRSTGDGANLQDAIAAAVNAADQSDGTPLTVAYSEVTSVGDPRPGSYSVLLSPGGS